MVPEGTVGVGRVSTVRQGPSQVELSPAMYSGLCGLAGLGLTVLALWPTVILTHGSDKSAPLRQLAPPL